MRLFVIVVCLLSERFLVHKLALHRFDWFTAYYQKMTQKFSKISSWLLLIIIILPFLFVTEAILHLSSGWLFGFVGLLFNLFIFYYCLGPKNPFYPAFSGESEQEKNEVGNYLVQVNNQMFAVMFWYVVLGPLSIVFYRMLTLCSEPQQTHHLAQKILGIFDWLPVRVTALLYLLAGNFQLGFRYFSRHVFSTLEDNEMLLKTCGFNALAVNEEEDSSSKVSLIRAEHLVEHAVIILLLLTAFYILASSR